MIKAEVARGRVRSRIIVQLLVVLMVHTGSTTQVRADVGPPVDVKISFVNRPAVSGQIFNGVFEIQFFEPGTLTDIEVFGDGWDVQSIEAAADRQVAVPSMVRIPFRALPNDANQPIGITFTFDSWRVRRLFEVGIEASKAVKMPNLVTALRAPIITPAISSTDSVSSDGDADGVVAGDAMNIRVMGQVFYQRAGIDENDDGDFDDEGDIYPQLVGVDNVSFRVIDIDTAGAELMREGRTDVDGKFDTGTFSWKDCNLGCEDPDIVVSFFTNMPVVNVTTSDDDTIFALTIEHEDFAGGTLDLGPILISPVLSPAFHIFNSIVRTERFIRLNTTFDPPKVQVKWPDNSRSGGAWYTYGDEVIHISTQRQWKESTHAHEFGHHFISNFSLVISPDYCNGICDEGFDVDCGAGLCTDPGHCGWCEENEHDAWSEGWPNWLADVVTRSFSEDYTFDDGTEYQPLYTRNEESPRDCCIGNEFQDPLKTEGFVAMLLRDIEDDNFDNHDDDEFRDSLCLGVDEIFNIVGNYFPTNIVAFMNAFILEYPEHIAAFRHTAINVAPIYASVANFPSDTDPINKVIFVFSPSHHSEANNPLPCIDTKWLIPHDDVNGACEYSFLCSRSETGPEPNVFANEVGTDGCSITGTCLAGGVGDNYFHIKAAECGFSFPDEYATFGPFNVRDCNSNGIVDVCEIGCSWTGTSCWDGDWCQGQKACGFAEDCNDNKVPDDCDLADGTSEDCNNNGIPDECELMGHWGGETGTWHDGTLWKEDTIPGDGYHICVEEVPEEVTVLYQEGTHNIASLSCSESLTVESHAFPAAHSLLTLTGDGFVTGDLKIRPRRNQAVFTTMGSLTIDGQLILDGGTLDGPGLVLASGGLSIVRASRVEDKLLQLYGDSESSNRILIGGGAVIHNNVRANWNIVALSSSNSDFIGQTGGALVNDGTIRMTVEDRTAKIACDIENAGEFYIDAGTLSWWGTTSSTGSVNGAPGTVFELACGRKEFLPSSIIAVDGFRLTGGSCGVTNIRGTVNIASWLTHLSNSPLTFTDEADIISYGPTLSTTGAITFDATVGDTVHFDSLTGGTLVFHSLDPLEIKELTLSGSGFSGGLSNTGPITVTQLFNWRSGARLSGPGDVNVTGDMVRVWSGNAQTTLANKVMNLSGLFTINAGFSMSGKAVLNILPAGTIDFAVDTSINGGSTTPIHNDGRIVKSNGIGISTIAAPVTNTGLVEVYSGILRFSRHTYVQTAGETILNGGDLETWTSNAPVPINIQGGALKGNGTVTANTNNTGGVVAPGLSIGDLVIDGQYVQSAPGILEIELGGKSLGQYDTLNVTETATLGGELKIVAINDYIPTDGDAFIVLTAGEVVGGFDAVTSAHPVTVWYTPTHVAISFGAPPTDLDLDGDTDLEDFSLFLQCYSGSKVPPSAGCPAAITSDLDNDNDVDLDDYKIMVDSVMSGPQ